MKRKSAKIRQRSFGALHIIIAALVVIGLWAYFSHSAVESPVSGTVEFHFIDVGQGDSTLIVSEDGAILIDTGLSEYGDSVISYISGYTNKLDYLILTHPDSDHIGAASRIVRSFPVDNVIMTDCPSASPSYSSLLDALEASPDITVLLAEAGQIYNVGEIKLEILAPLHTYREDVSANDHSIVTMITHGSFKALFTGDAEKAAESELIDTYSAFTLKADLLHVGHHGSKTSSTVKFISAVSPSLAVISCGKNNSYGHPHSLTLRTLNAVGAEVLRTDERGHIVVISNGSHNTVH